MIKEVGSEKMKKKMEMKWMNEQEKANKQERKSGNLFVHISKHIHTHTHLSATKFITFVSIDGFINHFPGY